MHQHRRCIVFLLLACLYLPVWSQSDSLSIAWDKQEGYQKAKTQLALAKAYIAEDQIEEARKQLTDLKELSQKQSFEDLQVEAYLTLAITYTSSDAPKAFALLDTALLKIKTFDLPKLEPQARNYYGRILAEIGNFSAAIEQFLVGYTKGLQTKNIEAATKGLNGAANCYYFMGQVDSAIAYYKINIELSNDNAISSATPLMNVGIMYDYRGQSDSALLYYMQALEIAKAYRVNQEESMILSNLGTFYDDRGDLSTALTFYNQAYEQLLENNQQERALQTKYNISRILQRQNQISTAITEYNAILKQPIKVELKSRVLLNLAEIYLILNEANRADSLLAIAAADSAKWFGPILSLNYLDIKSRIQLEKGNLDEAEKLGRTLMEMSETGDYRRYLLTGSKLVTQTLLASGRTEEAFQTALLYYQDSLNASYLNARAELSDIIIESLHLLNRDKEIIPFYREQRAILDSINTQEIQQNLALQLLQSKQIEYQMLQNELENKSNELLLERTSAERKNYITAGILIVSLLLLVLVASQFIARQRIKKKNQHLEKLNRQVAEQNESLHQLNEERSKLMHIVAHDLKSPLNSIKGLISLIPAMQQDLPDDQREILDRIDQTVNQGIQTIEDIFTLEQVTGKEGSITTFPFQSMLEQLLHRYTGQATKKSIQLLNYCEATPIDLTTDQTQLFRIMDNLLSNAIKFTPLHGKVTIRCKMLDQHAHIAIADNGQGFSEEDKQHLYKRFKKLGARPTGGESSTGVGLAIAKEAADRIGATLYLDSIEGQGSTFTVAVPLDPAPTRNM